jgi:hypothetical protein
VHILVIASRAEFQIQAFLLAHFADDNALRPHSQRFADQMVQADLSDPLQIRLPVCLHPNDIRQRRLQLVT